MRPVTVESVLPTGPTSLVQFRVADQLLFAEAFHEFGAERGDTVTCSVRTAAFHLFDSGGDRLAGRVRDAAEVQA